MDQQVYAQICKEEYEKGESISHSENPSVFFLICHFQASQSSSNHACVMKLFVEYNLHNQYTNNTHCYYIYLLPLNAPKFCFL